MAFLELSVLGSCLSQRFGIHFFVRKLDPVSQALDVIEIRYNSASLPSYAISRVLINVAI